MIKVHGNTFVHREYLKSIGGQWNPADRIWTLPSYTRPDRLERVRSLPGVWIGDDPLKPIEQPKPKDIGTDTTPAAPADTFWSDLLAQVADAGNSPRNSPVKDGTSKTRFIGNDLTHHNAFRSKNPAVFAGFDSLAAFTDWVKACPRRSDNGGEAWSRGQPRWAGTNSMEHALIVARNGWNEGVEKAKQALEMLDGEQPLKPKRTASIAGGRVNIGRMLSGSPVHMVSRPKRPGSKLITLFVEVSVNSNITPESMIANASVVAAICDMMESLDYSCEIVAVDNTKHNGRAAYQVAVTLKRAGDPLSLNDIVFGLGHPSFLRRFVFAVVSCEELRFCWSNYGQADVAFDSNFTPDPSYYYIETLDTTKQSAMAKHSTFEGKARALFPLIVPDGFPISIA